MIRLSRRSLWLALGLWAASLGQVQAADPATDLAALGAQDDRGRPVARVQAPQRIVSLLPSLTETVCALGACDRLVGVDRYSNWPEDLQRRLPVLGGGLDPNVEAIVALKPDVVLLSNSARVVERLEALGLRTVALEPRTQADVQRVLHSVGHLLRLPPAQVQQQWQRMQDGIDAAARTLPAGVQGGRVYFEVSRGPFAAGPSSFIGELLHALGLANIIGPELGPFPKINPELVVRADPDLIMAGERSGGEIARRPGWSRLRAVRGQHVCVFNAAEVDILVRPGPRMPEAARLMARCVLDKGARVKEGGR